MKLLATLAIALAIPQGGEVVLRIQPKAGAVYHYQTQTKVKVDVDGQHVPESSSEAKSTLTIKEVNEKGASMEMVTTEFKGSQDVPIEAKDIKMAYTMTPLGQLSAIKVEGGGETGKVMAATLKGAMKFNAFFPEKAVRVGEAWKVDLDLSDMFTNLPGIEMTIAKEDAVGTMHAKLDKLSDGIATVSLSMKKKMRVTAAGTEFPIDWTLTCTYDLETESGMTVKQVANQKQILTLPNSMIMNLGLNTVMTRIEPK